MTFARGVVIACLLAGTWASMRTVYQNRPLQFLQNTTGPESPGDPLFLTPFIEDGQIDLAKHLAKVGPLKGHNVPSYSGYLTVNKTTESNMFFWFFPAYNNARQAPIILWLQGGPGGSSLFGLFVEHGPYKITAHQFARLRRITWAQQFNMLYIDNPVGTGFSFTKTDDGYVTNETEVGRDLFEALQQFFTLFSEYAQNDFYVTGESYAGKYVPAAAYTIHKNKGKAKMKLAGIAIGDGLCDPATMFDYADFLLQIGLLDNTQATHFRTEQNKAKTYIEQGDYISAFKIFDELLNGDKLNGTQSYFKQVTGLDVYYNFLLTKEPASFSYYNTFVQTPQTRRAIHVGNMTYNDGSIVEMRLEGDIMRSVKPWIAELMNNYKVMIYNGQLDIIIAAPLTASFVNSIPWDGANALAETQRIIWRSKLNGDPAGYVRKVNRFTEVLVRNAGHILPYDQPHNAYDMIDRFVNDKPFD
ncbi:putative serine carboxypeptidase CPVL isoform 1 [Tropilaelaps mercedesae]|uniref:Carboxypeptidase n=1 Tax=Tropilaelaps mercedesae TaxID=418985 RepID=A0A1V9XHE8_9ACAR|nr:putative serine carboxypeptidase CPVL isoform 1 [Tropilaelaps mercedesae]